FTDTTVGRIRAGKSRVERARRGKLLGPGRRRAAIAHLLRSFAISERMACRLAGLSLSACRSLLNQDTVDDPEQPLRSWLCHYAKDHAPIAAPVEPRGNPVRKSDRQCSVPCFTSWEYPL